MNEEIKKDVERMVYNHLSDTGNLPHTWGEETKKLFKKYDDDVHRRRVGGHDVVHGVKQK